MREAQRHDTAVNELEDAAKATVSNTDLARWMGQDLDLRHPLINPEHRAVVIRIDLANVALHGPDHLDWDLLADGNAALVEGFDVPWLPLDF